MTELLADRGVVVGERTGLPPRWPGVTWVDYAGEDPPDGALMLGEVSGKRSLVDVCAPEVQAEHGAEPRTGVFGQLRSPAEGRPTSADLVGDFALFVWQDCDSEWVEELDAWYDEEHIPMLMRVPGWLRIRRFVRTAGTGAQFLTIHDLAALTVFADDRYASAVGTRRRDDVARHRKRRLRSVLRRLPEAADRQTG